MPKFGIFVDERTGDLHRCSTGSGFVGNSYAFPAPLQFADMFHFFRVSEWPAPGPACWKL